MINLNRYAIIRSGLSRELILLQGTGCLWKKCSFCDYHKDISENPFFNNKEIIDQVTGEFQVLDVINSGSAMELDFQTIEYLQKKVADKKIKEIWFEAHYLYKTKLSIFSSLFPSVKVNFRCGVESFNPKRRAIWKKGIPSNVTPQDIAEFFQGVCLLVCVKGQTKKEILNDIEIARKYFKYFSVNVFCDNSTQEKRDPELVQWFLEEVYPTLKNEPKAEILVLNTDLGVG